MPVIDIESLLNEISPDNQAGEDMEYDPAFIELMEAVEGSPGQQVGDTFVEGVEPDWKKAQSIATELFSRTKDIRVGVYLVQALINTHAYAGLADGVLLLERLVSRYWDTFHPQLDPDDNDPTMRINVIATLADFDATINPIRQAPLVSSKMMGRFSLRDIDIANGVISLPDGYDGVVPDTASINAAFMDTGLEALQQTKTDIDSSVAALKNIDVFLVEKVGSFAVLDLKDIYTVLGEAEKIVSEYLIQRGVAEEDGSDANEGEAESLGDGAQAGVALSGQVNNPRDVLTALDKIIIYYQRNEPSSPIPAMLGRVKGWVSMDFFAILEDIAPDGVKQAQTVVGDLKQVGSDDSSDAVQAKPASGNTSNW